MKSQEASKPAKNNSDTEEDDAENEALNPGQEDIEAMLKYKMTKQAEAEKIRSYQ